MSDRIDELEMKLAWLESGHEELSQIVTRQQQQLDTAEKRLQLLIERLSSMGSSGADAATDLADEIPPHY